MGLIEPPELLRRHRLTVDAYHRMAEAGVLAPDARVDGIEGEIVDLAPIGSRHGSAVKRLNQLLMDAVDLDNHVLRVCRQPVGDAYAEVSETSTPGLLSPLLLPGVTIDTSRLLG